MKVIPVTEQEAKAALPETFDDHPSDVECVGEEAERAANLLLQAIAANPDARYFKIVLGE